MQFRVVLPIFTADGGHLGVYIHFWGSDFDRLSFTICLVGQKTVIKLSSIFLGGEVVYRPVYIVVLTLWRPSWTPSWILEKAPAGITGFSMLFLMVFGRFPEKFSLGIFFSPSKPNTIRLFAVFVCFDDHLSFCAYRQWCMSGNSTSMSSDMSRCGQQSCLQLLWWLQAG